MRLACVGGVPIVTISAMILLTATEWLENPYNGESIFQRRPMGDSAILPEEFPEETKDRGLLASWCVHDQVLANPSIGTFLSHRRWNSIMGSVCGGVPLLRRPFFADQQTNCRYSCIECGMKNNKDVKQDEVEVFDKETMDGEKGKNMRVQG
ncbi:hypothetical protein RJ639_037382 [Escallonia herrerae]|uniref:Uncharacterized protein n=1 Tax=Escallonia herrerae TaxID=1293975 RepID=A0AA89B6M0_9ASTE|nr:hypothetical protein RJ639_037382 [Escallonia herrerae]